MTATPAYRQAGAGRSKAPLTASLSTGQFVKLRRIGFDFLPSPSCGTVSQGRREVVVEEVAVDCLLISYKIYTIHCRWRKGRKDNLWKSVY